MGARNTRTVGIAALALALGGAHSEGATVAHWTFEEGPANTTATGAGSIVDVVNGLNGTPQGGPTYRSVAAPVGALGLEFDGSNDKIRVPDDPLFAITGDLTVEAIIRLDGITPAVQYNQILWRGDTRSGLDPYFLAVRTSGRLHFSVGTELQTSANVISPDPLPFGQVVHVAGTLDDATGMMKLFVNGTEVNSITTSLRPFGALNPTLDPGVGLGALHNHNGQYFDGIIAEARISNESLTSDQFLPSPSAPIAYLIAGTAFARRRRYRAHPPWH